MPSGNLEHVMTLIRQLLGVLPSTERQALIVFGSAAIVLNGVDLPREVDDLDVFVSAETFSRLALGPGAIEDLKNRAVPRISYPGLNVEIFKTFPGVTFAEVYATSLLSTASQELRFGSLEQVARWKRAQEKESGSEKHRKDLEVIEAALRRPR